jgi:hypothetical protein
MRFLHAKHLHRPRNRRQPRIMQADRSKREPRIDTPDRGYGFRVQPCGLPRNDGVRIAWWLSLLCPPVVTPRKRVSSTPRLLDSITGVSGILDRPPSRAMTAGSVARIETVMRAVSDWNRHCEEPTGRANARPMTGSATKQSRGRHSGAMRSIEPGISRFPDVQLHI